MITLILRRSEAESMGRKEKTVFISYRRTNAPWALAIYQDLTHNGYDVFYDYKGIASGDFESVILENIRARAHFLILLTPSALQRCVEPGDWLRREIETALGCQRNIIPLMLEGFDFSTPAIIDQLRDKLVALKRYNALNVPVDYFSEAMDRLRQSYLNVALDAVLQPASDFALQAARDQQAAARAAPTAAFIRAGNDIEAIAELQTLIDTNGPTPYHLGMLGGRYKRLAIRASPSERQRYLNDAIKSYEQGMELDLNEYYCSSNLPRLYRIRGAPGDENRAQNVLRMVISACQRAKRLGMSDEWLRPTLLGAAFDAGDADKAEELVHDVIAEGQTRWKVDAILNDLKASLAHVDDTRAAARLSAVIDQLKVA